MDAVFGTLRLVDPTRPDAYYKTPITKSADGSWVRNNEIGLTGGNNHILYNLKINKNYGVASIQRPKNFIGNPSQLQKFVGDLKSNNIKAIVSLDKKMYDDATKKTDHRFNEHLKEELKSNGIEYISDPNHFIEDFFNEDTAPKMQQLSGTVQLIVDLRRKYPNGTILVHCGAGDGRSGIAKTALAMYDRFIKERNKYSDETTPTTSASTKFESGPIKYTPTYRMVSDSLNDIRKDHPNAVERPEDIALLNQYFRHLFGLNQDKMM
ncbi:hypothetical protein EVG18_02905 [Burkholderia pyrrocinia]|nr:hypothetical protein EVG18_02905 [Burkholderia pyrrocinia]